MELTQLRAFCSVASDGSVTAAAARLSRVPSSLTARIQQLERQLGVQLFIRHNNRLRLSAEGRGFLDYATRIVSLADEAELSINSNVPSGTLRLGALDVILASTLPAVIAQYCALYPAVMIDLTSAPSHVLERRVIAGDLDAALTDRPRAEPLLESRRLYTDELMLITALKHRPVYSASDLEVREAYAFRSNCSYRQRLDDWFAQSNFLPSRVMEMESYHAMLACVSAGIGVAWIPRSLLVTMPEQTSVRAHSVGPAGMTEVHLIWRHGLPHVNVRSLTLLLDAVHKSPAEL